MDFENVRSMDPQLLHYRVGLSFNEFEQIVRETPSLSREETEADPNTSLAIYLMLRTGKTYERLMPVFTDIPYTTT